MAALCTLSRLAAPLSHSKTLCTPVVASTHTRSISSSPYGRTHVWRRRANKLPNPVVPQFPQKVIRADGSTFVHWTTSPRSLLRLTRDVTNNPMWNLGDLSKTSELENEGQMTGRMGRFNRRFGEGEQGTEWMGEVLGAQGNAIGKK